MSARIETKPFTPEDRLITKREVAAMYGVHMRTVPMLEAAGRIPKHVQAWKGQRRWLYSECLEHVRGLKKGGGR